MAYVEAPYPVGVVVLYSSPSIVAVMTVPSGTSAPSNFTIPAKLQEDATFDKAMLGERRHIDANRINMSSAILDMFI